MGHGARRTPQGIRQPSKGAAAAPIAADGPAPVPRPYGVRCNGHGSALLMPEPQMPLAAGSKAPDFTLHDAPYSSVSLSDLLGRAAVLVFYVADWHPVSTDQLIQLTALHASSNASGQLWLGSPSTAHGRTQHSGPKSQSRFRCCPTIRQRARSPVRSASTQRRQAEVSALCSFSMHRGWWCGAARSRTP